jgi:hypothetical protein
MILFTLMTAVDPRKAYLLDVGAAHPDRIRQDALKVVSAASRKG